MTHPLAAETLMKTLSRLAWALAILFAIAAPFILSGFRLYQLTEVLIDTIALIGLNLLTGYNGQISLGHGAFFALGGYGAAILTARSACPFGRRFRWRASSASSPASCSAFPR